MRRVADSTTSTARLVMTNRKTRFMLFGVLCEAMAPFLTGAGHSGSLAPAGVPEREYSIAFPYFSSSFVTWPLDAGSLDVGGVRHVRHDGVVREACHRARRFASPDRTVSRLPVGCAAADM